MSAVVRAVLRVDDVPYCQLPIDPLTRPPLAQVSLHQPPGTVTVVITQVDSSRSKMHTWYWFPKVNAHKNENIVLY